MLAGGRFFATARVAAAPFRWAQTRAKSTLVLPQTICEQDQTRSGRNTTTNPIPNFDNARIAFESKSTVELVRAAACFSICKIPVIVNNAERLLKLSRIVLGNIFTDNLLRATFYGHFCAGQDQRRIRPLMNALQTEGVGSILDYAAENVNEDSALIPTSRPPQNVAREYDYESEAKCDKHVSTFLQCIRDVATNSSEEEEGNHAYAAIKVTALGNPKLLARLSTAIVEAKRLFSIFDENGDGLIGREEFEEGYNRFFTDGDVRIQEIFDEFDPDETGVIDYITWSMMLSPQDLPKIVQSCQNAGRLSQACPTPEEIELLDALFDRGRRLATEAADLNVRLLVDAEQVRYQPAIDNLVLELQRKYNIMEPIVYNTYQCYLRDAPERLQTDLARSKRFGYHFGAKLVRGAYMESERELAAETGAEDPIHATIADTHSCYNDAIGSLLRHSTKSQQSVEIMCATHNRESIVHAIEAMNKYGIERRASTICFAQLYGMSDPLTFNLGKHGYRVYKYVPYGEVHEVMPYLLRRAQENSAIIGGATDELAMIGSELKRRLGGVALSTS